MQVGIAVIRGPFANMAQHDWKCFLYAAGKGNLWHYWHSLNFLVHFDGRRFVDKYLPEWPRSDKLKDLIDKRRSDTEREYKEATYHPDGWCRCFWTVEQRRLRDSFAGSFAGDGPTLLQDKYKVITDNLIITIHVLHGWYSRQRHCMMDHRWMSYSHIFLGHLTENRMTYFCKSMTDKHSNLTTVSLSLTGPMHLEWFYFLLLGETWSA